MFSLRQQGKHVADLLPIVLTVKSFTINNVTDVADFSDYTINLAFLAFLGGKLIVR